MNSPLITLLIRVSRPEQFKNCIESIVAQTYDNYRLILHADNYDSFNVCVEEVLRKNGSKDEYISKACCLPYRPIEPNGFHYNLYCNILKENAFIESFFMYLDDDDTLNKPDSLEKIAVHLTNPDELVICQMLRGENKKPADIYMDKKVIGRGRIGMCCFFLHSKHKDIAYFVATEDADYLFIKEVSEKLPVKFVKQVVVNSPKRSFGLLCQNPSKGNNIWYKKW